MSDQNKQLNIIETTYLYKKTEKLVSALYLVSNFLSDKEPIKWQLRELGINLLSFKQGNSLVLEGVSLIKIILSLLQVAHIGGLISEMNFNIFKYEFESQIQMVEQAEKESLKGHVLSEDFFAVPEGHQGNSLSQGKGVSLMAGNSKGQPTVSDRLSLKSNRQDIIIGLLKKGGELGIKDFTTAIKGCSEKTIQRELATLVSKGQVKKMGEKRWSRYSLK